MSKPAIGLLLMRVGFGGFMVVHGWGKLLKFTELSGKFASFLPFPTTVNLALALVGELLCPLLVIAGIGTRWAALPTIVTMLVAAFGAHSDSPFGEGEHALLFAIGFGAIALLGPGPWSVDEMFLKKKAPA